MSKNCNLVCENESLLFSDIKLVFPNSFSKLQNFFIYKGSVNSKITIKKLEG